MSERSVQELAIHAPAGQYSHATLVKADQEILYVAGQVGMNPNGEMANGIRAQIDQTWRNLLNVLAGSGMAAEDLVHINYYLTSTDHVSVLREVRKDFLPSKPPSSTAIVVASLIQPSWLFEMDAVAAR